MASSQIRVAGRVSVAALRGIEAKSQSRGLRRLISQPGESYIQRYQTGDKTSYNTAGHIYTRREVPEGHFLNVDHYTAREFVKATATNVLFTRNARAVAAAGRGFLDEFNVNGSQGIPDQLLSQDLKRSVSGVYTARNFTVQRIAGEGVPLGHYGTSTFGHFILDALLQVYIYKDEIISGRAKLLHWPLPGEWMGNALGHLGIHEGHRKQLSRAVVLIECAHLSSALAAHGVYFPAGYSIEFMAWLRTRLTDMTCGNGKLYVRRSARFPRRILNQALLEKFLIARGFDILDPDAMSVQQQAAAFAKSEMVVGAWGSGMTLSPLLSGRKIVVELIPSITTDPWFFRQALVHELEYYPLIHPTTAVGDGSVNLDEIASVLKGI